MGLKFKLMIKRIGLVFILFLCICTASVHKAFCPKKCKCNSVSTIIQCSRQKLTNIPQGIPATTEVLDLGFNNIASITPISFQNLSQLIKLDLRSNKISNIADNSFISQKKMTSLVLQNNDLVDINNLAFWGAESLADLYLSSNRLLRVPSLCGLFSLQKLVLDTNQISNLNFPMYYKNFTRLNYINLANNKISHLSEISFTNLSANKNLRKLSLSRNGMIYIHPQAFAPLKSIESLKLAFNPLTSEVLREGLSSLNGSSLLSLDISSLSFANELPASTFQLLVNTSLRTLILNNNFCSHINNDAFQTLPTLLTLKLTSCGIQTISKNAFHGLTKLVNLFLSHNELGDLKWDIPHRLQYLYLEYNKIQMIPKEVFGKLVYLKVLYLDYNKIHEFQKNAFVGLGKLQKLRLSHNSISTIGGSLFSSLVGLESMELQSNSITKMANDSFSSMTQLLYLNLANNNFLDISPILLSNLQQLHFLFLSNNRLGNIFTQDDFITLLTNKTKLNTLDLCNNQIQGVLSKNLFMNLFNLEELLLAKNQISSWDQETFHPTYSKLAKLDFRENHIATIEAPHLQYLKNLQVLKLSQNPYACNCQLRWFRDWLKNTTISIPDVHKLKCNSPKAWQGKHLLKFDRSKIDCTDYTPYYIYGGIGIGLITTTVFIFVLHSYQWYIRFFFYKLGKRIRGSHQQGYEELPGHDFAFDMYINYTDTDLNWVIENVMKHFDNGVFGEIKFDGDFRLCMKDRDFESGSMISNLVQNIQKSQFSLIVLSRDFNKDRMSKFELDYCLNQFKYENSHIIIVMIGNVKPQHIPDLVKPFVEKDMYIKWEDNENAKRLFKEKVQDILTQRK